eukprot:GHVL01024263.1.p1 GENE.GHVL01024263.1~~GHVL01024263.1.p1  ORF type:complete len:803 (+),score=121.86 GHVL01024263.1:21-2429(+)
MFLNVFVVLVTTLAYCLLSSASSQYRRLDLTSSLPSTGTHRSLARVFQHALEYDTSVLQGMRVHYSYNDLKSDMINDPELYEKVVNDMLPSVTWWFKEALRIFPVKGNLKFEVPCAAIWSGSLKCAERISVDYDKCDGASLPDESIGGYETCPTSPDNCSTTQLGNGIPDSDFLIMVRAIEDVDCETNTLAYAVACRRDQFDRPIAGFLNICTTNFKTKSWAHQAATLHHELIHALGFGLYNFAYFRHKDGTPRTERDSKGLPPVDSSNRPIAGDSTIKTAKLGEVEYHFIVTETVIKKTKEHFGCENIVGMPLENTGGDGSAGSHWEQRILNSELMTSQASGLQLISEITLALLEDTGWYYPDYSYAMEVMWGSHRLTSDKCAFFTGPCISSGIAVDDKHFCTESMASGCTLQHHAAARCVISTYASDLPESFQYFANPREGGSSEKLDYCPRWEEYAFFDRPGVTSDCTNLNNAMEDRNFYGETYGKTSRCFTSTLLEKDYVYDQNSTPKGRCMKRECIVNAEGDAIGVRININSSKQSWIECSAADEGNIKTAEDMNGHLVCPPLTSVCFREFAGACANFGSYRGGACYCPVGFIGHDCTIDDTKENRAKYLHHFGYPSADWKTLKAGIRVDLEPEVEGNPVSFNKVQDLPEGLSLDTSTGIISGTPPESLIMECTAFVVEANAKDKSKVRAVFHMAVAPASLVVPPTDACPFDLTIYNIEVGSRPSETLPIPPGAITDPNTGNVIVTDPDEGSKEDEKNDNIDEDKSPEQPEGNDGYSVCKSLLRNVALLMLLTICLT